MISSRSRCCSCTRRESARLIFGFHEFRFAGLQVCGDKVQPLAVRRIDGCCDRTISRVADWRGRQSLVDSGVVRVAVIAQLVIGQLACGNTKTVGDRGIHAESHIGVKTVENHSCHLAVVFFAADFRLRDGCDIQDALTFAACRYAQGIEFAHSRVDHFLDDVFR